MAKGLLFFASTVLLIAACTASKTPTSPTSAEQTASGALGHLGHAATMADSRSRQSEFCCSRRQGLHRWLVQWRGRAALLHEVIFL